MSKIQKKLYGHLKLIVLLYVVCITMQVASAKKVEASGTANIRFIFTTDLHGQINRIDYETDTILEKGGLARAYDGIQKARDEVDNFMTFDVGDVIYDYTTEYIYATDPTAIQPIYQAMKLIGYDAVTLGNHEFDYDYAYLTTQLKQSGMMDRVIVSNVTDSKTGEHPFLEHMLVEKKLTTVDGGQILVKIGIIGETFPSLSSKNQDFTGVLKVEDIVTNVERKAKELKQEGADIIVVLSHSGMGPETPEVGDKNVSYALTKIDEVDVVLCGHEHNAFPSEVKTGLYYKLSGVDKKTDLVHGKNLVMAEDRGKSIGIVDLQLQKSNDKVVIQKRNSEVRKINHGTSVEVESIATLYDPWSSGMLEYTSTIIGSIREEHEIENFTGLVEDTNAMQLLNNAKIAYALEYVHTKGTKYADTPVIAASSYVTYGANSYLDYVHISGELTESDLASLQKYNGYTALYEITGAQLKEWLEWSASAYKQTYNTELSKDKLMSGYEQSKDVNSLLSDEWLNDWSTFYVFDGIEYNINPVVPPRYNHAGVKINTTNRITQLTCNGEAVTDDQVFVLAVGKLAKTTQANAGVEKQGIYKGYVRTQGIIKNYMEQNSKVGEIEIKQDYNWSIEYPKNHRFLIKTTTLGLDQLKSRPWFIEEIGTKDQYTYSIGSYANVEKRDKINLIVTPTYTEVTSKRYKVAVSATGKSSVQTIKYASGEHDAQSSTWLFANEVTNGYFYVDRNGTYTVYAIDRDGHATVEQIVIDNIFAGTIKKPTINTYTNRKSKLSGTAEPGNTIVIKTPTNVYETVADTNGAFQCKLPYQMSGTQLTIFAVDHKQNTRSQDVFLTVKRTGPNQPSVQGASNHSDQLKGNLNDTDAHILAIVDQTVYVPDETTAELYRTCESLYEKTYEVIVTDGSIDYDMGYRFQVPVQTIGTKIDIYTIDHLGRLSAVNTVTVEDKAPNPPQVYDVTAADNKIQGKVTSSQKKTIFSVYVSVGTKQYEVKTDTSGYFSLPVDASLLTVGTKIRVYAEDFINNIRRTSYTTTVQVLDPNVFVSENNDLSVTDCYVGNDYITGTNDTSDEITIGVYSEGSYTVYNVFPDEDGTFDLILAEPLIEGDILYAHTRAANGNILDMVRMEPMLRKPEKIMLKKEVKETSKQVVVYTDVRATVVLTVGKGVYESTDGVYDKTRCMYEHIIPIDSKKAGVKVKVYAYNEKGKSKVVRTEVQ